MAPKNKLLRLTAKIYNFNRELGQAGYLLEIPIIVFVFAIFYLVVGRLLPKPGNIILLIVLLILVFCYLIYAIFFPGWRPKSK